MEQYFATMFKDVRHERSPFLSPSVTDLDKLKQSKIIDDKINKIKHLAQKKLHTQRLLKEYVAVSLMEIFFCLYNYLSKFEKKR